MYNFVNIKLFMFRDYLNVLHAHYLAHKDMQIEIIDVLFDIVVLTFYSFRWAYVDVNLLCLKISLSSVIWTYKNLWKYLRN